MAALVLSLPVPLILLVHLHILEYPHANKSEYDHNIFNAQTRGLRDRIKTLEDVCYFLVSRLEGNARTILPTYPCVQPSDTVAFRTSLAKYLESLRHQSVYPSSKASVGAGGKVVGKSAVENGNHLAWWWKDVVVRRSLLEECSGEKFERLLLSVSTHALLKGIKSSAVVLPDNTHNLLRTQPSLYTELLSKSRSRRHAWSRSAAVLLQRQDSHKSLRDHITAHNGVITSKYSYLETERLVTLVGSKLQDLHHKLWHGREGRLALESLASIYGLRVLETLDAPHIEPGGSVDSKYPTTPLQPLPIAAAHHPANLKKLRRPIFSSIRQLRGKNQVDGMGTLVSTQLGVSRSIAEVALSGYFESELRTQRAMVDALARVRKIGQELLISAKVLERKHNSIIGGFSLAVWQPADGMQVGPTNFDAKPTSELLLSLSLYSPSGETSLESQIDSIRDSVLPPYPTVPNLFDPRRPSKDALSNLETHASKIPRANTDVLKAVSSKPSRLHTLESSPNPPLITSTPSATIKTNRKVPLNEWTIKNTMRRGLKVPRKSIRYSLAVNSRPSLFPTGEESGDEDVLDDEVHRIVHGTEDESMEDILVPMTPKAKAPPANRIFTGTRGSTIKRPKQSYPMAFHEPSVALPSLAAASASFNGLLMDSSDEEDDWTDRETPNQKVFDDIDDENEECENEAPSMTLRDILLRADTTQLDLLEEDDDDGLQNESFEWD